MDVIDVVCEYERVGRWSWNQYKSYSLFMASLLTPSKWEGLTETRAPTIMRAAPLRALHDCRFSNKSNTTLSEEDIEPVELVSVDLGDTDE